MTVNNELLRMWKEMVVIYFKVLPQHFPRGIKKATDCLEPENYPWTSRTRTSSDMPPRLSEIYRDLT